MTRSLHVRADRARGLIGCRMTYFLYLYMYNIIRGTYAQIHLPHPLAAFILHLTRPISLFNSPTYGTFSRGRSQLSVLMKQGFNWYADRVCATMLDNLDVVASQLQVDLCTSVVKPLHAQLTISFFCETSCDTAEILRKG